MKKREQTLFSTPLHRDYWRLAASEFKRLDMLAVAALFLALRIAIKPLSIPIAENLRFSFDFLVNSVGSMIYGPLVGLAVGALSDTLGYIIHPTGVYFFPFMLVEMSSSFLFGLFLYRTKLTPTRIILSRFSVTVLCNLLLTPLIIKWQAALLGNAYALFTLPRMLKNVAEFPFQSVILVVWLGILTAVTDRMKITFSGHEKLKITKNNLLFLAIATAVAALVVAGYCLYRMNR